MLARENTNCLICGEAITAGVDEVSWARRGENQGKVYHTTCKSESPTPTPATVTNGDGLALLANILQPYLKIQREEITEELDERINAAVAAAIESAKTKTVYIQAGKTIGTIEGSKHEHFDLVAELVSLREDVYLWGEAGSGKSTAARQIAELFNLPFYYLALQAQMTESRIMGYMMGEHFVETDFFRAYKNGGVFLLDELDLGNGNMLGALNGALANGDASFPCGKVKRHPDFICIATGNTCGIGATVAFSDRKNLDGAVRDRFTFVQWDTDKALELQIAAAYFEHSDKWAKWVQSVREFVKAPHPKLNVTQRATVKGCKYLALGKPVEWVAESLVFKGYDRVVVNQVLNRFPLPSFAGVK